MSDSLFDVPEHQETPREPTHEEHTHFILEFLNRMNTDFARAYDEFKAGLK